MAASPRGLAILAAIVLALPALQAHSSDTTPNSSTTPSAQNQGTPTPSTPAAPSTPTTDQSTTPTTTPDASTSTTDDATKKLPKTASERPLMLLLASVALAGAGITSLVRRTRSA